MEIHPFLQRIGTYRRILSPHHKQLKQASTFAQLIQTGADIDVLTEFEFTIISHHERMTNFHLSYLTEESHREGLQHLIRFKHSPEDVGGASCKDKLYFLNYL